MLSRVTEFLQNVVTQVVLRVGVKHGHGAGLVKYYGIASAFGHIFNGFINLVLQRLNQLLPFGKDRL